MTSANKQVSVVISRDGPYIVSGNAPLTEDIIGANARASPRNGSGDSDPAAIKAAVDPQVELFAIVSESQGHLPVIVLRNG